MEKIKLIEDARGTDRPIKCYLIRYAESNRMRKCRQKRRDMLERWRRANGNGGVSQEII